jgi:hypothetical protein
VVVEGHEICFSMKPLPECTSQCRPADKQKRSVKFHCLFKGPTAEHWQNMVKRGVNPDFSKKAEHKQIVVAIPTKCSIN